MPSWFSVNPRTAAKRRALRAETWTLADVLCVTGMTVEEVRDWRNHNRNHKGPWGPVHGIMIHHTVTSGAKETVDLVGQFGAAPLQL